MKNELIAWLEHPAIQNFIGSTAMLRLDVLAVVTNGSKRGKLAALARRHTVSPQAVYKIAAEARRAINNL